jgi:hypothetical protein
MIFLCSRNALGLVCLVGRSFGSVWFLWMNFQSDQPNKPNRPDRPAFVGRAPWKINPPPSLKRERASVQGSPVASFDTRGEGHELERETIPARACRGLSAELLGWR